MEKSGAELERDCLTKFEKHGWILNLNDSIRVNENKTVRPDASALTPNGNKGLIEFKNYSDVLLNKNGLSLSLLYMVEILKPAFFILSNGAIYELYLKGKYYGRLTSCPEPEDIDSLLEKGDF